ncbi:MAG: hypothetical protein IPM94_07010 [bacterium]|nr:hypothetical protein [bacterium]
MADRQGGWLRDYDLPNVAVFDYHDILTDGRSAKWSAYASGDGSDSHPSREGNARARRPSSPSWTRPWPACGPAGAERSRGARKSMTQRAASEIPRLPRPWEAPPFVTATFLLFITARQHAVGARRDFLASCGPSSCWAWSCW